MGDPQVIKDVIIPLGTKPLEARGEAASFIIKGNDVSLFVCALIPGTIWFRIHSSHILKFNMAMMLTMNEIFTYLTSSLVWSSISSALRFLFPFEATSSFVPSLFPFYKRTIVTYSGKSLHICMWGTKQSFKHITNEEKFKI